MGKCAKCGKSKLFLKLDKLGFCSECSALHAREIALNELEQKTRQIEAQAADADLLLLKARAEARAQALQETEILKQQLEETVGVLRSERSRLLEEKEALATQVEKLDKQARTAENRIVKSKDLYKSMQYAMELYMRPWETFSSLEAIFSRRIEDVLGEPVELKCLTMKTLRSMYRANEKKIQEVTEAFSSHYTTKANATIYKLMVMALNAELSLILGSLSFGKIDQAIDRVKAITSQYYTIAAEGNQTIITTLNRFIGQIEYLFIEAVKIEYEYYVQRERAKEEQRAIREQMRQEAEERKQLEAQRKKIEEEEKKYQQEMDRVQSLLNTSNEQAEIDRLKQRIAELTNQMNSVAEKKEEIVNLQNGKAGTVYIISNIGSFGDDVFKIGMTRRLEPQDRVTELGDASVPFPFDVHSFIFSEDAVALETALHRELNAQRVNKVNLRKEFFRISLDELERLVERIDPSAPFNRTILAEQYHQSLSIEVPTDEQVDMDVE